MRFTDAWSDATVVATTDLTPTVREFLLRPATGAALAWEPGAHLRVQVLVGQGAQTRSYSLVGQSDGDCWRIAVKRMDDGRGGSRAMWRLAVGETVRVSGPHNHFPLARDAAAYLLVAGGIGITPLVGMAQALQATGARVRMVYGARSRDELAYAQLLGGLLGPALHTCVADEGQAIDFAGEIAALPPGAQLYTCGPVGMLEAVRRAWSDAARPLADLRFETFGSSGQLPVRAFQVMLPGHGMQITVPADTTLLEALEAAGVDTISDCRRGECGLCAMDVMAVDGEIDHRDVFLSQHEKQSCQRICTCVSRVAGTVTLDTGWRPDAGSAPGSFSRAPVQGVEA